MGILVNKTDFVGAYALSKSIADTIDPFILKYEARYLRDLLGVELYDLFNADLTNQVPADARFVKIYDELYQDETGYQIQSEGMKNMILGFLWFEYVRSTKYKHTDTAVVVNAQEISRTAGWTEGFIYKIYNESLKTYWAIQCYVNVVDSATYPEFKGLRKKLAGTVA